LPSSEEEGMPWKECHVMDERLRFVARLLEGEKMAPLCAERAPPRRRMGRGCRGVEKRGFAQKHRHDDCYLWGAIAKASADNARELTLCWKSARAVAPNRRSLEPERRRSQLRMVSASAAPAASIAPSSRAASCSRRSHPRSCHHRRCHCSLSFSAAVEQPRADGAPAG